MRTRMYGGVRGRKTKVGGKPTLFSSYSISSRFFPFVSFFPFFRFVLFVLFDPEGSQAVAVLGRLTQGDGLLFCRENKGRRDIFIHIRAGDAASTL